MENVQFKGSSNPGWYFTIARLNQLNLLYDWITNNLHSEYTYKELRVQIQLDIDVLDDSKSRMFFPWLKRYGLVDYNNDLVAIKDLVTPLGKKFFVFNKIYLELYEVENIKISTVLNEILEDFICQFFINLLESDKALIYQKCVRHLKNNQKLTKNQFYILTNSIEENKDEDWVNEMMDLERKGKLNIEIKKNANSWEYNMQLLNKAGLILYDKDLIYPQKKFHKVIGGLRDGV